MTSLIYNLNKWFGVNTGFMLAISFLVGVVILARLRYYLTEISASQSNHKIQVLIRLPTLLLGILFIVTSFMCFQDITPKPTSDWLLTKNKKTYVGKRLNAHVIKKQEISVTEPHVVNYDYDSHVLTYTDKGVYKSVILAHYQYQTASKSMSPHFKFVRNTIGFDEPVHVVSEYVKDENGVKHISSNQATVVSSSIIYLSQHDYKKYVLLQ